MTSFSEWVRQIRRSKDLTLHEVADRAGVKQPVWSQWESGKAAPRRETVLKIAEALQVSNKEALLRAGYLPSEPEACETEESRRLWAELEPILMGVRPERRRDAERLLIAHAQTISDLFAR